MRRCGLPICTLLAVAGDAANFPWGRGPQGDAIRIENYVRLVRSADPDSDRVVQPDVTPVPFRQIPGGPGGEFHLIPRFAAEQMNLTAEQRKQIAELEQETKAQLDQILAPRQPKTPK